MRIWSVMISAIVFAACSGETNLNQFWVSNAQLDSVDIAYHRAEYQFDTGEFDDALANIEKAYKINPENEKVATLYGYILLALAGIDPFQMTEALMNQSSESETSLKLAEDNAAGTLSGLSFIVDISDSELVQLGELNSTDSFPDMDVIRPSDAPTARNSGVQQLARVNKAIEVICPFIDEALKIESDPRHDSDVCVPSERGVSLGSKGSFLWAFSHLTDALTFNKVLNYSTGAATPNIQKRSAYVNSQSGDIATYLSMVSDLSEDIDSIFDTADPRSQLNAVLNGLTATSEAFGKMAGIPPSLSGSIKTAVESLRTGSGSAEGESTVLKGQMTSGVSSQLSQSISTLAADDPAAFAASKAQICGDFVSISGGQAPPPPECN